jgi:hypothetical protein
LFSFAAEGEGAEEKELLGFKFFIWVASFSEELAPWYSFLSWGLGGEWLPLGHGGEGTREVPQP